MVAKQNGKCCTVVTTLLLMMKRTNIFDGMMSFLFMKMMRLSWSCLASRGVWHVDRLSRAFFPGTEQMLGEFTALQVWKLRATHVIVRCLDQTHDAVYDVGVGLCGFWLAALCSVCAVCDRGRKSTRSPRPRFVPCRLSRLPQTCCGLRLC